MILALTGVRFGMLVVGGYAGRTPNRTHMWHAMCDCRETVLVTAGNLRAGDTQSCGCLRRSIVLAANRARTKHQQSATPEYRTWLAMRRRCHNATDKDYWRYGAKGVSVCAEWRDNFKAFFAYVGPRPPGTTMDRIDGGAGYAPGNVRWATAKQQAQNRKSTLWVDFRGSKVTATDAAALLGATPCAVFRQLKRKGILDGYNPRVSCKS